MDRLRRRREALWLEFLALETEIACGAAAETSTDDEADAGLVEFLATLDGDHRVIAVSYRGPGTADPLGQSIYSLALESHRPALKRGLEATSATGRPHHVLLQTESKGDGSWVCAWLIPRAGTGNRADAALDVIAFRLTDARQAEEAPSSQSGALTALLEQAPDSIVIVNRELRIEMANRTPDRDQHDVVGRIAGERLSPSQRELAHAAIRRVFETGNPTAFPVRLHLPSGDERWYRTRVAPMGHNGRVERVVLISSDETAEVAREQQRAEEADKLRQSEARYRTLVDHAPEAIVIFDAGLGRFVDANDKACELYGLSREALLRVGPAELSPEFQPDGARSLDQVKAYAQAALDGAVPGLEWTILRSDGTCVPTEVRLVRLTHPERQLMRASVTDISERKRAEAERQRLTEQLLQSQKNEAIGHLTGGIAHDFNNLLTVIVNSLEMVGLGADDPEQVRLDAEQALEAAQRAAELTKSLLAFARRQPLRPRPLNLNKLVLRMKRLLRRTLGEDVAIETALGAKLWMTEVDLAQLESALLNLAINARDAMPDGGKLTIETTNVNVDQQSADAHPEVEPGQYTMLVVTDTGTGMSREVAAQAFEPFFTTKEVGRGSGLGLSMVFGFVKQSGGHVKIHTELGVGTSIRIYLPRFHGDERRGRELPNRTTKIEGAGRLVLVVDDESRLRALLERSLRRMGFRTLTADNVDGALALVKAHTEIALLLTDVVLPGGKNGARLAREALALRPGLSVLFMSGYTEDAVSHNGRLAPGVTLLEKPFSQRELGLALAEALENEDHRADSGEHR